VQLELGSAQQEGRGQPRPRNSRGGLVLPQDPWRND